MDKEKLLKKITENYLNSRGFNGYSLHELDKEKKNIIELVSERKIDINFGDKHPNVHIKAFKLDNKNTQLDKIKTVGINDSCAYPTKSYLKRVVNVNLFAERPFTLKIAQGEAVLNFVAFDSAVLEFYRNDPRYIYHSNSIGGYISISSSYESKEI